MSFDFQDNSYISRNGRKSSLHRQHALDSSMQRGSHFDFKTSPKRMETKLALTVLSWIGFSSYIAGILLNIGTWKSDILFWSGIIFIILKIIRISIRTWQAYKREEIEQEILKKNAK